MTDQDYIDEAFVAADISKYNGTHVGAILVKDGVVISHGVNGYPVGVDDDYVNSLTRDERLDLAIHAEENALLKLMNTDDKPEGATAYVTHYPCVKCAGKLYSVGVKKVIVPVQDSTYMANWVDTKKKLYEIMPDMEIIVLT